MTALGLLVLRLTVAVALVAHGSHQLLGWLAGPGVGPGGLTATAARFVALGLSPGFPLAVLAGVIQLVSGLLIGLGVLTRWAALAAMTYLALIVWRGNLRWGFFLNWVIDPARGHGVEYAAVLGGALLCLVFAGAGDWSFDGWRARVAASRASGRARLRVRNGH
jgi:putative oxidoreductase